MSSQVGPVCDRCKNVNSLIVVVENVEWCNRCGALYDGRNLPQPYRADLAPSLPEDEGERVTRWNTAEGTVALPVEDYNQLVRAERALEALTLKVEELWPALRDPNHRNHEKAPNAGRKLRIAAEQARFPQPDPPERPLPTADEVRGILKAPPDPEPTVCPTCGSDDPASMYSAASGSQTVPSYCPDPFHSGPPDTSHPPDGSSEGRRIAAPETTSQEGETERAKRLASSAFGKAEQYVQAAKQATELADQYKVATERQSLRASMAESRYEKAKAELERIIDHADKHKVAGILAVIDQARLALANLETEE